MNKYAHKWYIHVKKIYIYILNKDFIYFFYLICFNETRFPPIANAYCEQYNEFYGTVCSILAERTSPSIASYGLKKKTVVSWTVTNCCYPIIQEKMAF